MAISLASLRRGGDRLVADLPNIEIERDLTLRGAVMAASDRVSRARRYRCGAGRRPCRRSERGPATGRGLRQLLEVWISEQKRQANGAISWTVGK